MTKPNDQTVSKPYDSNPFSLAFNSFMRMFNTNTGWAVVFLIFALLGAMVQFAGNIADIASTTSTDYEQQSTTRQYEADDNGITPLGSDTNELDEFSTAATDSDTSTAAVILLVVGISLIVLVFVGVMAAAGVFITGMFTYVALQSEKGKAVQFSEAWGATVKRFWRLLGAQLLAGLKIFGWTLLFIVPGIIAALRYTLLPYVVMSTAEDEKGIKNTHNKTKSLVKGRLMEVFGIATVAVIIPFIGSMLELTGNAALYTQLQHYNEKGLEKPKVHWLNYLGLILIALLVLFALFIGGIILLIVAANN